MENVKTKVHQPVDQDSSEYQDYLTRETKRLLTLPNFVWLDLRKYLKNKYSLSIPQRPYNISYFLYVSGKFRYDTFVKTINVSRARVMFVLLMRKLGFGMMKDPKGFIHFVPLNHLTQGDLDMVFEVYKRSEVYDVVPDSKESETDVEVLEEE